MRHRTFTASGGGEEHSPKARVHKALAFAKRFILFICFYA
jgi:hypothetical protein